MLDLRARIAEQEAEIARLRAEVTARDRVIEAFIRADNALRRGDWSGDLFDEARRLRAELEGK